MRYFIQISIFLLSLAPLIYLAQSKDSTLIHKWKKNKDYPFQIIQFSMLYGTDMPLEGNTFNICSGYYPMRKSWGSMVASQKDYRTNHFNIGIEIRPIKWFSFGAYILPLQNKFFKGYEGTYNKGTFIGIDVINEMQGRSLECSVESKAYAFLGNFIILPYKQMKKVGIEISSGVSYIYNTINIKSNVVCYDVTYDSDGQTIYHRLGQNFEENFKCSAFRIHLRFNLYFSKYFSLVAQLASGEGSNISSNYQSLNFMTQTAFVPVIKEGLTGSGGNFGICFHLLGKSKVREMIKEAN